MSILEAQADFGINLLRTNPYVSSQSIIISPISISIALAMCFAGAKNKTAEQISKTIARDATNNEMIEYFSGIMEDIRQTNRSYELYAANKIYVNKNYPILDSYKEALVRKFHGQFQNVNFSNPEVAANEINIFIEKATKGKIDEIISHDSINAQTRMMITNAIYFKGTWQYKFDTDMTAEKKFFVKENEVKMVPTMWMKTKLPYYENHKVQVLGLPYKDNDAFLYVLLPREQFGLKRLLRNMNGHKLNSYINYTGKANNITAIDIELPRFKVETSLSLTNALLKVGIKDAFSRSNADFSGITGDRSLYIDEVLHKAFIECLGLPVLFTLTIHFFMP
uniref:Serpin domain-containing protein n=1 Tax=Acrobeloides nanus TaxID=290746 RepID=A0A914DXC2_9BILA